MVCQDSELRVFILLIAALPSGYSYLLGLTLTYSCPFLRDPGISTGPRDVSSFLAGMREGVVLGRVVGTGAMPREDALVDEASQGRPGELGASSEMVG